MKFVVNKTQGRYTKHCVVCNKQHKRGYSIHYPVHITGSESREGMMWFNFVCSKKCADFYIFQNMGD